MLAGECLVLAADAACEADKGPVAGHLSLGLGPRRTAALFLLSGRSELNFSDILAEFESRVALSQVALQRAEGHKHARLGVAAQRVLQGVRELAVAVWDVRRVGGQGLEYLSQRCERLVDGRGLHKALASSLCLGDALGAGEVDKRELAERALVADLILANHPAEKAGRGCQWA